MKRRAALLTFILLAFPALNEAGETLLTGVASVSGARFHKGATEEDRGSATAILDVKAVKPLDGLYLTAALRLRDSTDGRYSWSLDPLDDEPDPSAIALRELKLRASPIPALDLEAGRFELGWGKTDGYSPADAFLPRDLTDPFSEEKLGLWGVRISGQRENLRGELVASPFTTPWRFPEPGSRYLPLPFPRKFIRETVGDPPDGGFAALRALVNVEEWDLGLWARTGVLPAPWLEFVQTPYGFAPTRRFTRETGVGVEVSRLIGTGVARAEAALLDPEAYAPGDSLIVALGFEHPLPEGTLLFTWAKAFTRGGEEDAIPLDRALLPLFISALHHQPEWGSVRLVWTAGLRHGDGVVKLETGYDLTENWKHTLTIDQPYGPRSGPLGRLRDAARIAAALSYSW